MPSLPTGTVTFLFTDIEGSTPLWDQHPDAMPAALARHHAILREAIESHSGHVFEIVGDAFCAAFATASDALSAAVEAQRALHVVEWGETPIRVRMGLHTGSIESDGKDYRSGPTLIRVTRVMALAYGGQILLSQATAELVRRRPPAGVTLRDLGEHRLKGLIESERIVQMVAPYLPDDFPPLKSASTTPNNLPVQLTSFIGREREIAEIKHWLSTARLVTLTGAGGTGKTRLSLRVAGDLLDEFADGVWFVELAPLSDAAFVPNTVTSALSLPEQPGRPLMTTLTDYLRDKHLLLILDNCEHVVEACAKLADALLHAAPRLKILASSREALSIGGEVAWRVPSLEIPNANDQAPINKLTESSAVQLFIARATFALPTFALTQTNAPAVAQICRRLDGMPLAIELAAARVKALSAEQIAARLDDRFRLLTTGSRTAVPRQQTLRAAIDWSYDLLTALEQVLLRRLSVFAGGWTLEATEEVCGASADVLNLLTRLVEKSLVVAEEQDGEVRYRMLETIRKYGQEKLMEAGEGLQLSREHLAFFMTLAERAETKLQRPEQLAWMDRLETERDNLRAAIEWASGGNDVELGLRIVGALMWFWYPRGYWMEGLRQTQRLLARPEAMGITLARAKALLAAGLMAQQVGDNPAACSQVMESISLARELGVSGKPLLGESLAWMGNWPEFDGLNAARCRAEEGLTIARELKNPFIICLALNHLAILRRDQGDYTEARRFLDQSLAIGLASGNRRVTAATLMYLGTTLTLQGDYAAARPRIAEAISIFSEMGDKRVPLITFLFLGAVERLLGDYAAAQALYEECLVVLRRLGNRQLIARAIDGLGEVARLRSNYHQALVSYGEGLILRTEIEDTQGMAFSLESFARLAASLGQGKRAAWLFGAAEVWLANTNAIEPFAFRREHDLAVTLARTTLDTSVGPAQAETTFSAAWAEGRAMTMEQAIAEALRTELPVEPAGPAAHAPDDLSPREREVLSLVAQGLSDAQVAEKLVLSPRTINAHLTTIYRKLGVNSRSAATRYALDNKLG